jgi:hypothetical protein
MATEKPEAMEEDQQIAFAPSSVEAMVRGEIDVQIATAKKWPRSLAVFHQRAIAMATIDEDTAESCLYRRPVGKKKDADGKWKEEYAEGMSVRMSEIVGAAYGNLRVAATLVEQPEDFVRARGMAIDLETNFACSSEVIESTLKNKYDRSGKVIGTEPYSPRMRVVVAKAALSKARRDATFQVVPRALAKPVEAAVRHVLLGTAESLEKRRQRLAAWIGKLGIDERRVYAVVGASGPADLTAEKLEFLTGLRTAIKENDTTIDDAFPVVDDLPVASVRKSEEPPASPADKPPAVVGPASATPVQAAPPKPRAANIGKVVRLDSRAGGTIIGLDSGFLCGSADADLLKALAGYKEKQAVVELRVRPNPKGTTYAAILEEIVVQQS